MVGRLAILSEPGRIKRSEGLSETNKEAAWVIRWVSPAFAGIFVRRGISVAKDPNPMTYQQLVASLKGHAHKPQTSEANLDTLLATIQERERKAREEASKPAPDPIQSLRELVVQELIPVFVELVEKYSEHGISMQMDASNLLEGGRELAFEFAGPAASTSRYHQTHRIPRGTSFFGSARSIDGRPHAAPDTSMPIVPEFICDRLTMLLRYAGRRK
jgi:hypothetical protein